MSEKTYSLDELSSLTGLDSRVIRSYIEKNLLLGPQSRGRYARYSVSHLNRLLAIKVMKERGLKIKEIRQRLSLMTEPEIIALAQMSYGTTEDTSMKGDALDYIKSLDKTSFGMKANGDGGNFDTGSKTTTPTGYSGSSSEGSAQQPDVENWVRFAITPDVELNVRGIKDDHDLERIKEIAKQLRKQFLSGLDR